MNLQRMCQDCFEGLSPGFVFGDSMAVERWLPGLVSGGRVSILSINERSLLSSAS